MAKIANNCQIPFPMVRAEASVCLGPFGFRPLAEPSFVFSWPCRQPFPWSLPFGRLQGRVWEGATAPLPMDVT